MRNLRLLVIPPFVVDTKNDPYVTAHSISVMRPADVFRSLQVLYFIRLNKMSGFTFSEVGRLQNQ